MKAHISQTSQGVRNDGTVQCNNCQEMFKINIGEEDLGEVSHFGQCVRKFMTCPHCNIEYNIGFMNDEVTKLFNANRQLLADNTNNSRVQIRKNKGKGTKIMRRIETAWRNQL